MDTEKKVQFVALTKEEIDAMIQQAALAGAQVASDAMMVGQRKARRRRLIVVCITLICSLEITEL